jgi:hypothetical protein
MNNKEKEIWLKKTNHLTTTIIELINNVDNMEIQVAALSLALATILKTYKSIEDSMKILDHITSQIQKCIIEENKK